VHTHGVRIVVAAQQAQRPEAGDFTFTFDGEALTLPTLICSTPGRRDECGCGRAFSGIASTKATTFGIVDDLAEDEDADDFRRWVAESPHTTGWQNSTLGDAEVAAIMWADLAAISKLLDDVEPGTEVRVDVLQTEFTLRPAGHAPRHGVRSPRIGLLVEAGIADADGVGQG
jgi:hypothetical protein